MIDSDTTNYQKHVTKWTRDAQHYALWLSVDRRTEIAADLGLPVWALTHVVVGFSSRRHRLDPDPKLEHFEALAFPERDADFNIIGIRAQDYRPG